MSEEINNHIRMVFEEIKADKLRKFEEDNHKIEAEKRKIRQRMHEIENEPFD
jgi:hypothetical protein